jgi:prepilin-type N-terminal cleavage/methylation domain-containing protein
MTRATFSQQSGFSLVETLVAITILLIAIVGPMTILTTTSNSTSFATDQVTAFFLAQEGVELAQLARDNIVLNRFLPNTDGRWDDDPWTTFTTGGTYSRCFDGRGCGLYLDNSTAPGVTVTDQYCNHSSNPCVIRFDDTSPDNERFRFTHEPSAGAETEYTREIFFTDLGDEVQVRSEVTWFPGNSRTPQTITVETVLINVYGP